MRLYLSSQDFGKHAAVARRMAGENPLALFFKNAQDDLPEEKRNFSTTEKKKMFENAGFNFEEIDLRDFFGKPDELRKKLLSAGSVWSSGGNTFILRRAMRACGFDEIILDLLKSDQIMYGGWSAGSCVMSTDLNGIQFGDRPKPDIVPASYPIKETIWEGIGAIEGMIVPHCNQEWFVEQVVLTENHLNKLNRPYIKLNDGDVYIVDGDKREVLR